MPRIPASPSPSPLSAAGSGALSRDSPFKLERASPPPIASGGGDTSGHASLLSSSSANLSSHTAYNPIWSPARCGTNKRIFGHFSSDCLFFFISFLPFFAISSVIINLTL